MNSAYLTPVHYFPFLFKYSLILTSEISAFTQSVRINVFEWVLCYFRRFFDWFFCLFNLSLNHVIVTRPAWSTRVIFKHQLKITSFPCDNGLPLTIAFSNFEPKPISIKQVKEPPLKNLLSIKKTASKLVYKLRCHRHTYTHSGQTLFFRSEG